MEITEANKLSLANYLDTEGFIGIVYSNPENRVIPTIILVNTNKSWLEMVRDEWGGTISPQTKTRPTYKEKWQWHIHGKGLLSVLMAVEPHLIIKKEPAKLCFELQRRISQRIGREPDGRLSPQEREIRLQLYKKYKLLLTS